jgi:hypothetical protein
MTPGQFSNNLRVQLHQTFTPYPVTPPMFGGITPVPRGYETTPLPGPQMGSGWGMARQQAQNRSTGNLTTVQGLTGFGAELGVSAAVGGVVGTMFGGPIGTAAGIATGAFLGDTINSVAQMPFKPFIDQRNRAMQLQNISMYNVRSGPDLSASGIGLSNAASVDLERNLMRMADSRSFKRDTGNLFNRQDMMKITELSAQVGLLDNAQSVDQMSRDMGKIGRALATFMKVVEEPDVRRALQMMGNMRTMGMGVPEMNVAAQNARVYARMAGTTVQGVMQAGMQGANVFQQYGMSGATGFNIGMGAAGMAGSAATWMDPRQLNMLGGRQGVQDLLTGGAAQMSQHAVFLPGLAKLGPGGKLSIDEAALKSLTDGRGVSDLVRASSQRLSGMGPRGFVEAYSTQQGELKDELMQKLGPNAAVLLPMMVARGLMKEGAVQSMGAGLNIALGGDEKKARAYEVMFQSEKFWDDINASRRPDKIAAQNARVQKRNKQEEEASSVAWSRMGRGAVNNTMRAIDLAFIATGQAPTDIRARDISEALNYTKNRASDFLVGDDAVSNDLEEQRLAAGGGEVMQAIRPDRYLSGTVAENLRKAVIKPTERMRTLLDTGMRQVSGATAKASRKEDAAFTHNLSIFGINAGPEGYLLDTESEYLGDVARRNQGFFARNLSRIDIDPAQHGVQSINRLLNEQEYLGDMVRSSREASASNDNLSKLAKENQAKGISESQTSRLVAIGASAVQKYAKDAYTTGYGVGETTEAKLKEDLRGELKRAGFEGDIGSLISSKAYMNEVIRSARRSGDDITGTVLDTMESRGADVTAAREGQARRLSATETEKVRKKALTHLGQFEGKFDRAEGKKLIEMFTGTGEKAEVQKKLYAIAALRKTGNGEDRIKAQSMEDELRKTVGAEKFNELQTESDAFVSGLSESTLRASGVQFGKYRDKIDKVISEVTKEAQEAQGGDLYQALQKELGSGFAEGYAKRSGKDRENFVKTYLEKNPDKFKNFSKAELQQITENPFAVEELAAKRFRAAAEPVVSGGQSNETPKTTEDLGDDMISQLEAWSKQDRERADAAFTKFERGTENLLEYTNSEAGKKEMEHTRETTGKAAPESSSWFFQNQGWGGR